jgi:hypothetical protein
MGRVRYIVMHHCSLAKLAPGNPNPVPDDYLDAAAIAGRFMDEGLGTGGRPPYHGITTMAEVNEQILPLSIRGAHAIGYNAESIAWCVAGESRPASLRQLEAAAEACAMLVLHTGGAEIVGHTDLPGASSDPKKRCPRPTLDVAQFRSMVRDRLPSDWRSWPRAHVEEVVFSGGLAV